MKTLIKPNKAEYQYDKIDTYCEDARTQGCPNLMCSCYEPGPGVRSSEVEDDILF